MFFHFYVCFFFSHVIFLVLECDWQLRAPVPLMTHDHFWQLCEALNTSLTSQLAYKHTQTHTRIYPVLTEVCRQTHQIGPCRCDTYTRCFSLCPISQCSKQHAHTLFVLPLYMWVIKASCFLFCNHHQGLPENVCLWLIQEQPGFWPQPSRSGDLTLRYIFMYSMFQLEYLKFHLTISKP